MLSPFLLNKKVTLERSVITLDASAGSKRENWKAVTGSENISASIQPVSTLLKQEYASRQIIITHQIYTSVDLKPKTLLPSARQNFSLPATAASVSVK